jgi:hypothetical protein
VTRKDYGVGLTVSENSLGDPDQQFYENYVCGAERNYTGYCDPQESGPAGPRDAHNYHFRTERHLPLWRESRRTSQDPGQSGSQHLALLKTTDQAFDGDQL